MEVLEDEAAHDPVEGTIVEGQPLVQVVHEEPYLLGAGFTPEAIGEYAPDAAFAARYPRAEKYVDWPMLVVLQLRP